MKGMNFDTQATIVEIALQELGRHKAVHLLNRLRREVKEQKVVSEIGKLTVLCKFAFPQMGGTYDEE